MSYLAVLVGLAAAFLWGTSDYLAGLASRSVGEYSTNAYVFLFGGITIFIALMFFGSSAHPDLGALIFGAAFSVPIFFGSLFYYRAFRIGDFAINAPISSSYPVVIVLGSVFLLGQALSWTEILGLTVTILGIVLISTKFSMLKARKRALAAGVGSSVLAMILLGVPSIFAAVYAAVIGFLLLSLMWRTLPALIAFVGGYAAKQDLRMPKRRTLLLIIVAGLFDGLALSVYLFGIYANALALPIISVLSGLTGAVTVAYGLMISKERPEWNQWLGIAMAIAGAATLSYISAL
ncbi:MAG: DMT family transporter [Candidatus Micrarchaeota archaeon]|nr:DMT family transporter [Candidatus Micrarchaeota archaeon]